MMKRMLGFCACWAEAGLLAIIVTMHETTRAPQITLNMLMVAFLNVALPKPGPQPSPNTHIHRPILAFCPCTIMPRAFGRTSEDGKLAKARWMRYAFSALAPIFADHVAVWLKVISAERGAVRHRKAALFSELMVSGDFRHARCRRIGTSQRRASLVQSLQQKYRLGLTPRNSAQHIYSVRSGTPISAQSATLVGWGGGFEFPAVRDTLPIPVPGRQSHCSGAFPVFAAPSSSGGATALSPWGLHASKSGSPHSCEEAFNARAQHV